MNSRLSNNNNNVDNVKSSNDGDSITKMDSTILGETSTSGTTSFVNQNPANVMRVVSDTPHEHDIVENTMTGSVDQGLSSFMMKPIQIATGSITTQLSGAQLFNFSIGSQLLSNTMWREKVKGFLNVRGTAHVRLQINASPFQAGRIILAYIPQYSSSPDSFRGHIQDLTCITQLPHVEMSFQDTECELEIPYIAPTTHYNLYNGGFDWGTVFCFIYSPLATGSGGSNQVTYTCWQSFSNFELATPVVPQSGLKVGTKGKRDLIKKYRVNATKSNLDGEINEGTGPISSVLSHVSSIASTLYSVPMLAPIAGPTAWISNILAGTASAFGWSKPVIDSQVVRTHENPHTYLASTNEPDSSMSLALIQDNKVSVMPDVNLSGVDEMSINFIKRQKAFIFRFTWSATSLPGHVFSCIVAPNVGASFLPPTPFGAVSQIAPSVLTPISLLASLYTYWRGSLEFTIKLVKTQYHTGRLIVSFSQSGATTISNQDSNYLHREIIDIRDGDEFLVKVPFCSTSMWQPCDSTFGVNGPARLYINILNELVSPETASSSIEVLVEVRGGPDLEFAVPRSANYAPVIIPQSGGEADAMVPDILNCPIGGSSTVMGTTRANQLCIGESSTSVLQLIKRYKKLSTPVLTQNRLAFYPYLWGALFGTGIANGGTNGSMVYDHMGLLASCYAHSRGGIRYRLVRRENIGPVTSFLKTYQPGAFNPFDNSAAPGYEFLNNGDIVTAGLIELNPATTFSPIQDCGTAISVPMYGRTFTRLNRLVYNNTFAMTPVSEDCCMVHPVILSIFGSWASTSIYRCAADDFQFSFWIGVPRIGFVDDGV